MWFLNIQTPCPPTQTMDRKKSPVIQNLMYLSINYSPLLDNCGLYTNKDYPNNFIIIVQYVRFSS